MNLVVQWNWLDAESYWIQGDITEVVASALQDVLATGEVRRVQKILSILQSSGGIFCNAQPFSYKQGWSSKSMQDEIFGRALRIPKLRNDYLWAMAKILVKTETNTRGVNT